MGLRQTLYEAVYDALTSANLLSSTATVTAAFIDSPTASFPQVVVHPVDVNKRSFTFNKGNSYEDVRIMIDIWTRKNKDKDVIADEIDEVLSNNSFSGLSMVGWTESNAFESPGNNKLHLKTVIIDFLGG